MVENTAEEEDTAEEIYNYMVLMLAEGVYIKPSHKKEMIEEIAFFIDND
jgi:hypothetical protein